ncbi:MAG: glycosyltransferase family 61 protein [Proteobacteria bacterium]|nr:glycosyltransferase family 61 protein [Pseudomonadota bacterium]
MHTIKEVVDRQISSRFLTVKSLDESFPELKKQVLPLDYAPIETPEVIDMPFLPQCLHLRQSTYQIPQSYSAIIPDMKHCATENTLLDREGNIISESSNTYTQSKYFKWGSYFLKNDERISGTATLLRSASYRPLNDYYHVIIDNLPRLFVFAKQNFDLNEEIKLITVERITPLEDFFLKKLNIPGLKVHVVPKDRIYSFDNYIFSSFITRQFSGYIPKEYLSFFSDIILPKRPSRKDKRIYISRSQAGRRRVSNEDEVLAFLGKYGFEKYHFEKMSIEEQIETMYDAESIVAPHGAGLANVLFSRGSKVLELFGIREIKPNYYYLSKSCGCQYDFLCFPTCDHINDDFPVDIDRLRRKVEEFIER